MATNNNEKYYYMKLKENFFMSDEIIILEGMPDGYLYSNILLKLYLKSLKNGGRLMLNEFIPYSPMMISQITGHSVGVVEKALDIFKNLGLIDVLDNGAVYMLNIQNFIGKSSTEADRKRNYRKKIEEEKQLLTSDGQMSRQSEDKTATEIEKELDIEIEKELDIEIEKEKDEDIYIQTKLTDREQDVLELLSDLFVGWQVTDHQILYVYSLINERIPFTLSKEERDIKIYDHLHRLIMMARGDNVTHIYGWLKKVIPAEEIY